MAQVEATSVRLSTPILDTLGNLIRAAALEEAYLIFDVIEAVTQDADQPYTFTGDQLLLGTRIMPGAFKNNNPLSRQVAGSVSWQPLSPIYRQKKIDAGFPDLQMYRTGKTERTLRRYRKSTIEGRFGGITVDVERAQDKAAESAPFVNKVVNGNLLRIQDPNQASRFRMTSAAGTPSFSTVLGRIQVQIFPNIARSLLPGLASQRWSDVSGANGQMERETLSPAVALRLAGGGRFGEVPYRPLVLPIVQFFMLVRIPNAIGRALKSRIGYYK